MSAPTFATPSGTSEYLKTRKIFGVQFGKTGWTTTPVGFGGYRIDSEVETHREALSLALRQGCNLIDTSTNYTDGHSEKLIGEVLKNLFAEGGISREQIVVVTKVGYVQGENLSLARQRKERGLPFSEMVEYSDDCWHCISPAFLKDQIGRSLARLELKTVDVLLLHNPEYFLKADSDHKEYYRRIHAAFEYLESEVKSGRIQCYGISSNTFPEDRERPDYTSLQTIIEIAQEMGAKNFKVIQFPFNLYEPDAALNPNNVSETGQGETVLTIAIKAGLATLINRPFNAFYGQKLIRLADFPSHAEKDVEETLKEAFMVALQTETDYPAKAILPAKKIAWAHILRENFEKIHDIEGWKNILAFQIVPAIEEAKKILGEHPEYYEWTETYLTDSEQLFKEITDYLEEIASALSRKISHLVDDSCPALKTSTSLSQKALRVYRSIPGVDCVLVGMRKPEYVEDALQYQAPLTSDQAVEVLESIQRDIEAGEKN